MVLTSDMKKETNKERIYDMMEKYYGNDTANEEELNYIEEISKSTQATNDVINNMKEYIENMDDETLLAFRKCRYEGKGLENFTLNGYPTFSTVEEELEKPKIKQYMFKGETATKNIRQKLA